MAPPTDMPYQGTVGKARALLADAIRIVESQPQFVGWSELRSEARVAYAIMVTAVFKELMDRTN